MTKPRRFRKIRTTPAANLFALAFLCFIAPGVRSSVLSGALPTPPQQNAPWTLATQAPLELMDAMSAVFDYGMADPRGCEYREITILTGSIVYGDAQPQKTHGWLLPGTGETNRFAIAWNGLVYPVVKIGGAVELRNDLKAAPGFEYEQSKDSTLFVPTESQSISLPPSRALGAAILLRLGEEETAMRWWSEWRRRDKNSDAIWFVATRWLWARFDRALCAYLRGDDHLALIELRSLWDAKPKIEAVIRARGSEPKLFGGNAAYPLRFLWPVPILIADLERRAKNQSRPPQKIAALLDELENVRVFRGHEQLGHINLADSPLVQELIAQGEAAVPALLDAIEKDNRLTRSVDFYRYNWPDRRVYLVAEAAYAALTAILQNYSFGTSDQLRKPETRAALVRRARDFWAQYKTLGQADRWYFILADDKADPPQWLQAARSVGHLPTAKVRRTEVAALLARRADETSRRALQAQGETAYSLMPQAVALAQEISSWDRMAALPALKLCFARNAQLLRTPPRQVVRSWIENYESPIATMQSQNIPWRLIENNDRCAALMPELLWERQQLGDAAALDDYWKWLRRPFGSLPAGEFSIPVFEPLVRYRKTPEAGRVAWELFAEKNAPFNPILPLSPRHDAEFRWLSEVVRSSVLCLPAFRRQILRELQDTTVIGKVWGAEDRVVFWKEQPWPRYLKINDKPTSFRRCDVFARALSAIEGAPECRLFWPTEKRDKAVAQARDFLGRFGERIQPLNESGEYYSGGVRLVLPRLTRLASADDVARGAAIFTLTSPGEKRVVSMTFPRPARHKKWNAVGAIWQAEEIKINGQWQRFYGLVMRHQILRVSAEEVEVGG